MMWEDYGYVVASKYRKITLLTLLDHPKTPNQVAKETRLNISHVSRALREMQLKRIVECITPERVKGRVYQLTKKGSEIGRVLRSNHT